MNPLLEPVLTARFTLPDGSYLVRAWVASDEIPEALKGGPPEWLDNPSRSWPDPRGPIMLTGIVKAGREAEARVVLA